MLLTAVRQNFLIFKVFGHQVNLLHGLRWSLHASFWCSLRLSSAQGAILGCLVTGLDDGRPVIGLCGVALQRLVTYFVLLHDDFFLISKFLTIKITSYLISRWSVHPSFGHYYAFQVFQVNCLTVSLRDMIKFLVNDYQTCA